MADGSDMTKAIQDMVRSNGDEVALSEPPCILWKAEHENCVGCQYELGCNKVVRIMLVMLIPLAYTPTSFADHQAMTNRIVELTDLTMKAKTVKELELVPHT